MTFMFSGDFLERQKQRLLEEKERIEKILSQIAYKIPGMEEEWEAVAPPPEEFSLEEGEDRAEELEVRHSIEEDLEERLRRIKKALQKIDTGDYGICERCSNPIAKERLEVEPSALLCSKCALSEE